MVTLRIIPNDNTDVDEFVKSICFVSSDIIGITKKDSEIQVETTENCNLEELKEQLQKMMQKYKLVNKEQEIFFENTIDGRTFFDLEGCNSDVIDFGNGQIGFGEKGKFLLEYLDSLFADIAFSLNAEEKLYPVMLSVKEYSMTGYLRKTPQYAIFCSPVKDSMEDLELTDSAIQEGSVRNIVKEPAYALSPSACFHTYMEYRNRTIPHEKVVTFRQNVFRNEGRLNYSEIGRLCDYHVREIVMIGSNDFVVEIRDKIMDAAIEIMKKLELKGDITLASDSFVIPKMQIYRKIQRIDKSKYEMHLYVKEDKTISTASFNLHGRAFTDPFHISVAGCEDTVTACVGFGLQRWVLAFFAQYGFEEEGWPEAVREGYRTYHYEKCGRI